MSCMNVIGKKNSLPGLDERLSVSVQGPPGDIGPAGTLGPKGPRGLMVSKR